jgi:hypothetical protein
MRLGIYKSDLSIGYVFYVGFGMMLIVLSDKDVLLKAMEPLHTIFRVIKAISFLFKH